MSGHRRRKGHAEEHHVDERWLVSYSDMITVLMALFIVLYAMSTVDQKKYDVLKNSLATGFGVTKTAKIDESKGVVAKQFVKKHGSGFSSTTLSAQQEAKQVEKYLAQAGAKATVTAGKTTVTISLVGSSTYFAGNSADLAPETKKVLTAIAPELKKQTGKISIEGHAAKQGSAGSFGTDWNLAGQRAFSVLQDLVDHREVEADQISATSYGSANATKDADKNRRVDIVIHAGATPSSPSSATSSTKEVSSERTTGTTSTSKEVSGAKATSDEKTVEKTTSTGKSRT